MANVLWLPHLQLLLVICDSKLHILQIQPEKRKTKDKKVYGLIEEIKKGEKKEPSICTRQALCVDVEAVLCSGAG